VYARDPLDHLGHKENAVKAVNQALLDRVVVKESQVLKDSKETLVPKEYRVNRVMKERRYTYS